MDQGKTGRFIAAVRRERGYTQRALAEALGLSEKTVSKWECGKGLPEPGYMLPLCQLLGRHDPEDGGQYGRAGAADRP